MKEVIEQILGHAYGAWRFRVLALLTAWAVCVFGWGYVLLLPNTYQSQARVYVDADSVLKPLLTGLAVNTDVQNDVNLMSRVVLARPNLENLIRETGLAQRASSPEAKERMLESLPQRIGLLPTQQNVYTINFSDHDPQMAYRVVKTVVDHFVAQSLGVKRQDTTVAQDFLQRQIREYEERLRTAEERLANFKRDNVGLMPGETGDYYTRLQAGLTEQEKLKDQIRIAEERRTELQKQLEGEEPTFGIFTGTGSKTGPASAIDVRIAEDQRQLDLLLLQYTEKHPQVIALRETIEQLKAQRQHSSVTPPPDFAVADPTKLAARALDVNPVYQSMKINLSQTEVELVELRSKLGQAQTMVSNLRSRVNTIPEVEAQLARLNRDYDVTKAQHNALLQRLESARLSQSADESTDEVKLRIIEPAQVPLLPTGPNRPLFLSVVLLLAVGMGVGAALIYSQARPAFHSQTVLSSVTELPVLGTIDLTPTYLTPGAGRRNQFVTAFAALLAVYTLVMTFSGRLTQLLGVTG